MYKEKVDHLLHASSPIPFSELTHVNNLVSSQTTQLAYSSLYKHLHAHMENLYFISFAQLFILPQ